MGRERFKCRVQNAESSRPPLYLASAIYSSCPELPLAVLMEEIEIATNSFASARIGAATFSSTLPESRKSSVQYPHSSASSSTSPIFEIKAGFDFARHAAR